MGSRKFRKAIGAVKDQTSITLAKVTSNALLADVRVAIVKATGHKASPAKERHIQEILTLTCYSRQHVAACVRTIARRLGKTKDWVVALKALVLLQRLLHKGNRAYEQEVFFATKNGTRLLDMSDFRDRAWSNSWDFSAFVRMYALFLDEQLDYQMQARRKRNGMFSYEDDDDEEHLDPRNIVVRTTPVHEMQNSQIFSRMQRLMKLIDRFLACRPTGLAKNNRIVTIALWPIVKQSFQFYYDMTDIMDVLLDRFAVLDAMESMKVFDIFCRVAKQYDELHAFYCWCGEAGIARGSDYPEVNKISQKKLEEIDAFIKEKTQTEQLDEPEPKKEEPKSPEPESDPEVNAMKALLEPPEEETKEVKKTQDIGDLLDFGEEDTITKEDHADKLALALFGSAPAATTPANTGTPAWEAFNESDDWETALVQSASQLSKQHPSLPGGLNTLVLDGMYQQGAMVNYGMTAGSASSVAYGASGKPETLALPAPPPANGDPFAASLAVEPPSYVQMSDMEKKQRLLMEEQMMWQQYYQGQVGLDRVYSSQNPYNTVGYTYQH